MVKYKHILRAIHNYTKCHPTIAEIKAGLNGLSYEGMFQRLKDDKLLNPFEIRDYEKLMEIAKNGKKPMNDINEEIGYYGRVIDEAKVKDELFQYNRRLIEGLKQKPAPNIDTTSYAEETYDGNWQTTTGNLEQAQIEIQEKSINAETTDDDLIKSVWDHFSGKLNFPNKITRNGGYLKALKNEQRKQYKGIKEVVAESPGLIQNTTLYRGGPLENIHLKPGDTGQFKGSTSTSFNRAVGESFSRDSSNYFLYKIYAPEGAKGICGNAEPFPKITAEHEYLLAPGTKYTVKDIDYEKRTIEVVLQ